jgi:hypothetical protein
MGRQDGRIEKGQSLRSAISARAWNRAQDAADVVLGAVTQTEAGESAAVPQASNVLLVRNVSGSDVQIHGVLQITGVEIDPTAGTFYGTDALSKRAREFVRRPVANGDTPLAARGADNFVVCLEPIADGRIGRCAIGGAFVLKVDVVDLDHRFAEVRDSDRTQLRSTDCGVLQILWKESGIGQNKWALGCM